MESVVEQVIRSNLDQAQNCIELANIIKNKQTDTPQFRKYRYAVFSRLHFMIPKTKGRGNERFRKHRAEKYETAKRLMRKFDKYFNYIPSTTEEIVYQSFGIYEEEKNKIYT